MCKYILLWQKLGFLCILLTTVIFRTSANNETIYIYKNMIYSSHSVLYAQDNEITNIFPYFMNTKKL